MIEYVVSDLEEVEIIRTSRDVSVWCSSRLDLTSRLIEKT